MRTGFVVAAIALIAACGPENNGTASGNNGDNSSQNNETNTATTNNGTNAATNNASNGSTNGNTGSTNNASTSTNNDTTPMGCMDLDPGLGPCDPICQTGCDVGQHCVADGDPLEAMCEDAGMGEQGQACQADTECGVGLHCRSVGGGALRCVTYCNPNAIPTGCPANHACNRLVSDMRLGACIAISNECEAIPADTCDDPEECYDTLNGRRCVESGDTALGDPCTRSTDCQVGARCVGVDGMGESCRTLCDPDGDDSECDDGETCHGLRDQQGDTLSWGACY